LPDPRISVIQTLILITSKARTNDFQRFTERNSSGLYTSAGHFSFSRSIQVMLWKVLTQHTVHLFISCSALYSPFSWIQSNCLMDSRSSGLTKCHIKSPFDFYYSPSSEIKFIFHSTEKSILGTDISVYKLIGCWYNGLCSYPSRGIGIFLFASKICSYA
jgi:hypothetical protein